MTREPSRRLILLCFLLSGVAGLIYEIVWTKLLGLVLGNTVFSITTVLTAFMGGLALGSYVAGRLGDRIRNPLRAYGLLEIAIGAYCVAIPFLIAAAEPIFRAFYRNYEGSPTTLALARAAIAGVILLPPTTLMGATLPILARFFVSRLDGMAGSLGRLYGLNTLGAVIGACGTGFFLIPSIGVRATTIAGAAASAIAGFGAVALSRGGAPMGAASAASSSQPSRPATTTVPLRVLLVAFGVAGFASMVYQVAWTRALALTIGSSVYAFSLIVTAFILGLAIGPLVLARWFDRLRDPLFAFALVEIGIALVSLAVAPLIGGLPYRIADLVGTRLESFGSLVATEFAILFAILFLPTFLMGAAFPLVARATTSSLESVGRSVGTAYAANTLGAILGSFAGGFILLPSPLRAQGTIFAASTLNLVAALLALAVSNSTMRRRIVVGLTSVVALVLLVGFAIPRWDPRVLSSGAYFRMLPQYRTDAAAFDRLLADEKILYYKEGVTATIAVKEHPDGVRTLLTNGKVDASTASDMPTQVLSAHLPLLLRGDPKDVLVIGLGGGVTLGSTLRHSGVRVADCVEISPEIVEAADLYFSEVNDACVRNPRANLMITDGRNHLAMTDRRYDVITSEPSNPWIAGLASLFTREYFGLCRSRLNPGGVMCQWITTMSMATEDLTMVFATFRETFPESLLFESILGGDFLMVGFVDHAVIDVERLTAGMAEPAVAADLQRISIRGRDDLLAHFVCGPEALRRASDGASINTDDNSRLEFSAPRSFYRDTHADLLRLYNAMREPVTAALRFPPGATPETSTLSKLFEARGLVGNALLELAAGRVTAAEDLLRRALDLHPGDVAAVRNLLGLYRELVRTQINRRQIDDALASAARGLEIDPNDYSLLDLQGLALFQRGRFEDAERVFARQIAIRPRSIRARVQHGKALYELRRIDEAKQEFDHVLAAEPENSDALFYLGNLDYLAKRYQSAARYYERALDVEPDAADIRRGLGMALVFGGQTREGVRQVERAADLAPQDPDSWLALAAAYEQVGDREQAQRARTRADQLKGNGGF
ncbi:MAG: fused MFS/spermidine synthase [Planctomycetes bacterium]|nr:fused MFS/spermidine synthase [Planctomycetota bacterium]